MEYRYKVLRGRHCQESTINPKTGKKTKNKVYNKGDVVETHVKLDKKFGKAKFELLGTVERAKPVEDVEVDEEWEGGEEVESDGLDDMSVRELRSYAQEEEIDLGRASRKSDIVDVIREELASREVEA